MCQTCGNPHHTIKAAAPIWVGKPQVNKKLYNLIIDNDKLLQRIFKTSHDDVMNLYKLSKDPEETYQILQTMMNQPIINTAKNSEDLARVYDNVGKAWKIGMQTGEAAPTRTVTLMEGMIKENVTNYVTRLDLETRTTLGDMVSQTIRDNLGKPVQERVMPEQLAQEMSKVLNGNVSRSRMIARTETMRSLNLAGWAQNRAEGCTHFIVDNRAESCDECADEFEGEVFTIDQIDMLPPIHPNCACVPSFFTSEEEAQGAADDLNGDNLTERKE